MAQDQQTFKRASSAALIGLFTQLGLAIIVALLGLYAKSPALHAATWHLFGGLPIWVILWVLFNQHRLERIESLEAEQLARSDARAAALFDEAGENLALARRRLETLQKWWLPIVSGVVSAYLMIVGGVLLYMNNRAAQAGTLEPNILGESARSNIEVVSVVLIVVGFAAFLVARYVAGMTKVREWTLLRGGASYLMGVVLVAALLLAGAIAAYFDNPGVLAVMALLIPGLMVLLGLEMALGFVLSVYRPRRPGETNRPAFDSRILGLLTRPESLGKIINETINYQFGFEISRSWFYRLIARALTPLIVIGALVLFALTSMVIVAPEQEAAITRFGAFERTVGSGLSWKLPWPFERAQKYDVFRVHQVTIGSEEGDLRPGVPILWTNQHAESSEEYMVIAPTRYREAGEIDAAQSVAGELIGARVVVKYRIANLRDYLTSTVNPESTLQALATRRINLWFVTHDIDTLLTTGRVTAGETLAEQIQQDVSTFEEPLGMEVVFVGFEALHPPQEQEVAAAFHQQIDARQEKQSTIEDAEKQAITTLAEVAGSQGMALRIAQAIHELDQRSAALSAARAQNAPADRISALETAQAEQEVAIERLMDEAGGRAAQLIYDARAFRWQKALTARARAMRTASLYEVYRQAPDYFRKRMYLQTIAAALAEPRKIVIAGQNAGTRDIRVNLETETANLTDFLTAEE